MRMAQKSPHMEQARELVLRRFRTAANLTGSIESRRCVSQSRRLRARASFAVALERSGHALDDVGRVGGDLRGDEPLADVLDARQAEVLGRGHIAQEVGPGRGRHGPADGRDDVVVARGDVGDERAQDVERRAFADPFLEPHVHLDLVERDVPGALDHDLDAGLAGPLDQLAEGQQLLDLGPVGGVDRPTPAAGRRPG